MLTCFATNLEMTVPVKPISLCRQSRPSTSRLPPPITPLVQRSGAAAKCSLLLASDVSSPGVVGISLLRSNVDSCNEYGLRQRTHDVERPSSGEFCLSGRRWEVLCQHVNQTTLYFGRRSDEDPKFHFRRQDPMVAASDLTRPCQRLRRTRIDAYGSERLQNL